MIEKKLMKAIKEANRFLSAAKAAGIRLDAEGNCYIATKETAAAHRASMDLTRALAELRKP